jgi:hypothetical protein
MHTTGTTGTRITLQMGFEDENAMPGEGPASAATIMVYSGGEGCGGDVSRSLRVHAICGRTNRIVAESEPSMCQYDMVMETPAACRYACECYFTTTRDRGTICTIGILPLVYSVIGNLRRCMCE